jgi:hypothetical protein
LSLHHIPPLRYHRDSMMSRAAPHRSPGNLTGHVHVHARSGGRWRRGWLLASVSFVALIVLLIRPGSNPGGWGWRGVEVQTPPPLETLGVPSAGHVPLALTGPRGITIVASFQEGRQRFGQIVEPGTPGPAGSGLRPGAGPTAVVLQPAYLVAHGPFDVRAPPAGRA